MSQAQKPSVIVHLDLTAFFVSVERALNPKWNGQPIMVAGDPKKRGVVTCASYEVRRYGVRAGMATALAMKKCPMAIRLDSNFEAYHTYSRRVREILMPLSPVMEIASIDEFYLDWSGCERLFKHSFKAMAEWMQNQIRGELSLPSAVGMASNKMMAKIACNWAKPEGVLEILPGDEEKFLCDLPVSVLPGVGEYMTQELARFGIRTCGDVVRWGPDFAHRQFGAWGEYIYRSAKGEGETSLSTGHERRQISTEETFAEDTRRMDFIRAKIYEMAFYLSEELRSTGHKAKTVRIKIRYADWEEHTRQSTMPSTWDPIVIWKQALRLFTECDRIAKPIRLMGLGLVLNESEETIDLFREAHHERRDRLLKTMDAINRYFDKTVIRIGSGQ